MEEVTIVAVTWVLLTSLWVAVDSAKYRVPHDENPYQEVVTPMGWLMICVLFWLFGFPYYLVRKSQTLKDRSR